MHDSFSTQNRCRFGEFEIDLAGRTVRNGTGRVELPWRSYDVLRLLVEARGEVVPRETLFNTLWPGTAVDESSLSKCVCQLRKALSNGDGGPEYIETVPRIGYRLTVPVYEISAPAKRKTWYLAAAAAVLLLAAGWFGRIIVQKRQQTLEALDLARQGDVLLNKRDAASASAAILLYQKSVQIEPTPHAYSQLAWAIHRAGPPGYEKEQMTAVRAAEKCVELDPKDSECAGTLGFLAFYRGWQWERGERYLRLALESSPPANRAGTANGLAMLLSVMGKQKEALRHVEAAIAQGPFNPGRHAVRAGILYFDKRYEEAIGAADKAIALDKDYRSAWDWRALSQLQSARDEAAIASYAAVLFPAHSGRMEEAYRKGGRTAALEELLHITSGLNDRVAQSWRRARWKALLGDQEGAATELEVALEMRNVNLIFVGADPVYESMRENARYRKVLQRMALEKYFPALGPPAVDINSRAGTRISPNETAKEDAASVLDR